VLQCFTAGSTRASPPRPTKHATRNTTLSTTSWPTWPSKWLAQEYEVSLEKLLPLKARLAATDRLIDLIVYRLYGLTEEEVAVVENKR